VAVVDRIEHSGIHRALGHGLAPPSGIRTAAS
jgi:hypothetical protein